MKYNFDLEVIDIPRYVYKCSCGKEIEVNCSMKDYSSTVECECGENAERKVDDILPQNYIVRCGGFYGKKS